MAEAKLLAWLGLDAKHFKMNINDSRKQAKSFEDSWNSVKRSLAGYFTVGAIASVTKRIIDFASEIRHVADNMEVSTDALQALNAIGLRYGVTTNEIARGLAKIRRAQGNVIQGDIRQTEALEMLNIDVEQFIQMRPDEAMQEFGRAATEAADQATAFAAIGDIIGERIGPRLVALLKRIGTEGMQTIIDRAIEAGAVMDEVLITKLELLGTRTDLVLLKIRTGFAGALDNVANGTESLASKWGLIIDEFEILRSKYGTISAIMQLGKSEESVNRMLQVMNKLEEMDPYKMLERQREEIIRIHEEQRKAALENYKRMKDEARLKEELKRIEKERLAELKKLEQERRAAAKAEEKRIKSEIENRIKASDILIGANVKTRGLQADQYARIGGFVGGRGMQRPEFRRQERALEIQRKMAEHLSQIDNKQFVEIEVARRMEEYNRRIVEATEKAGEGEF